MRSPIGRAIIAGLVLMAWLPQPRPGLTGCRGRHANAHRGRQRQLPARRLRSRAPVVLKKALANWPRRPRPTTLSATTFLKRSPPFAPRRGEFADADNYRKLAINWRQNTLGQTIPRSPTTFCCPRLFLPRHAGLQPGHRILNRVLAMHVPALGYDSTAVRTISAWAQVEMDRKRLPMAASSLNAALAIRRSWPDRWTSRWSRT